MRGLDVVQPVPPRPVSGIAVAGRPLGGLTVLVVEDSRFASEAVRLLCLRSGARIRRADSLRAALRHLQSYRPDAAIIDMGLPDGNGAQLIRLISQGVPRIPAIIGISGDSDNRELALAAGADAFLPKPVESLAVFQNAVLSALPPDQRPRGLRLLEREDVVLPDQGALRDDLAHVAEILDSGNPDALDYIVRFLAGVARSAHDRPLEDAASALAQRTRQGNVATEDVTRLGAMVQVRLAGVSQH